MSDGGKGSIPRPFSVDQKTFADNWDTIFGKKKKDNKEEKTYEPDDGPLTGDQIKQIKENLEKESKK